MIEIDGSAHSGSGTILRYSVAMATLLGEPLHLTRIRAGRDKPGLRPQHLKAVQACSSFSAGKLEGAEVGSQEISYYPGPTLKGGDFHWDIGTAGSATMLAHTLLPIALFAKAPCHFSIHGGLFQDFAPSFFHMQKVLIPTLQKMGARIELEMVRPGYVPKGQGHIQMSVNPISGCLEPLTMVTQGKVARIEGMALASHLKNERVAERMAFHGQKILTAKGYEAQIEIADDKTSVQKGAAFFLRAETDKGCILGADQAGKPGRRAENIAEYVVSSLLEDLAAKAATDRHLADQLILFAALSQGKSSYSIASITEHVESNLWLVEKILGARTQKRGNILQVEGIGFQRRVI
jgi:RNA 3'-terminal phosphate cyclase (ATP)